VVVDGESDRGEGAGVDESDAVCFVSLERELRGDVGVVEV
jgi:hypothetical protein